MGKISEDCIRGIRVKPWFRNPRNLKLDQAIIEETIRNLKLTKCPVCKGNLSLNDNFDTSLPFNDWSQEKYCPEDNYIIRLEAHQYRGNTSGTGLKMQIFTNVRYSELIADSGELADFSAQIDLHNF